MIKVRHCLFIAVATVLAVVTLKEFGGHIKVAVGIALAWFSHLTASDWANYVTVAYGILQIISWYCDRYGAPWPFSWFVKLWKNRNAAA